MILKLLTIITLLIGVSSISLKEDISKEEISYYLENNLSELNKELKREGYDIILYEAKSYNIKVDYESYDEAIITLYNNGAFYFNYTDNLILLDYGTDFKEEYKQYLFDNNLLYNPLIGYEYVEDGEIKSFKDYSSATSFECNTPASTTAEGFDTEGLTVVDSLLYMKSRYGENVKLIDEGTLRYKKKMFYNIPVTINRYEYMQGFNMNEYSCYITIGYDGDEPHFISEGNCGLVSAYTVANYWMKSRHEDINVDEKAIYESELTFEQAQDRVRLAIALGIDVHVEVFNRDWPELYRRMRRICYDKYHRVEGLTTADSSTLIERALKTYGVNVDSIEGLGTNYIQEFINEINNNSPMLLSVIGNSVYGDHTMAACGYEEWKVTNKVWIFSFVKNIVLAKVKDGWSTDDRYFNFDTHHGLLDFCKIREV